MTALPAPRTDCDQKSWIARHEAARAAAVGRTDLLVVGDSLAERLGFEDAASARASWPGRIVILGGSGDRTQNILWRLRHGAMDRVSADRVLVMAGRNNLFADGNSAADTVAGIAAIVADVRRRYPDAEIFVSTVLVRDPDLPSRIETNKLLNTQSWPSQCRVVDLSPALLDGSGRCDPALYVHEDGKLSHPNADGYRRMMALLARSH